MQLYISCFTSDFEIMKIKWGLKREGKNLNEQQKKRYQSQSGEILKYNIYSGEIENCINQKGPFGLVEINNIIHVNDAKTNTIYKYSKSLELIDTITNNLFNDLHSINLKRNEVVISSSGVDSVLVFDSEFKELKRNHYLGKGQINSETDYSSLPISTHEQHTHVNFANYLNGSLFASLFHQGEIVRIGSNGKIESIYKGLNKPHTVEYLSGDYFIANSGGKEVLQLDYKFELKHKFSFDGWIQEIKIYKEYMYVVDADNSMIVVIDIKSRNVVNTIRLPQKYRISSILIID